MSRGTKIKEIEEFPRRIGIFFKVILSLFIFGTIGFMIIQGGGFKEALFRTISTLAFMFEENPSIPERLLEIFLAIVGVFLVWWVLWSVADMLLDGNLEKYLKTKVNKALLENMKDHIIIAGGGRVGEEVAKILTNKKEKFIIIELNPSISESLRKKGYVVIEGSSEQEENLIEAGIKNAKKIVITIPRTETNLLITLTSKELNPNIEVHARAEGQRFVSKLKKAGAKNVVIPEIVAGDKLSEGL
jgi:voltage-gated potassium channel